MVHVCCVPNCLHPQNIKRTFPVYDAKVFEIWLERVGNPKLFTLHPQKVHKGYRVCDRHFSSFCRVPNEKKLKFGSLPTLHLPGFSQPPTLENSLFNYSPVSEEPSDVKPIIEHTFEPSTSEDQNQSDLEPFMKSPKKEFDLVIKEESFEDYQYWGEPANIKEC